MTTSSDRRGSGRASTSRHVAASPALPDPMLAEAAGTGQRLGGALAQVHDTGALEDRIYKAVFESVMARRLVPGTKLPEASLCELFQASRSTVRLALQRLAHDHIVQLRPNRGARIAVPTPEETRQIFEARRELEASVLRLVARRLTPADVALLRTRLAQERQAMHRFDQPAWARLASGFHLHLAELSGNALLQRYLIEIVSRCSLIIALYETPGSASCEHDEHERLVDLLERGAIDDALALMHHHLDGLEQRVKLNARRAAPSLKELLGLGDDA